MALLFAATHPERTRAVVAYGAISGKGDTGPILPMGDARRSGAARPPRLKLGRGALFLEDFCACS